MVRIPWIISHSMLVGILLMALLPMMQPAQSDVSLAEPFVDYYWQYHGYRTLGHINSPLVEIDGYQMQYFEKGRLEDHRHETYDPTQAIVHSRLTVEMIEHHPNLPIDGLPMTYGALREMSDKRPPPDGFEQGTSTVTPHGTFVPDDPNRAVVPGYIVPPFFWTYMNQEYLFPGGWMHHFGLPLTQAFEVVEETEGVTRTLTLQAFERTILSYDPQTTQGWPVERVNVGTDALWARGQVPLAQSPALPPPPPQRGLGPRRIEVSLSRQWLYAYEGDRLVMDAPVSTGKEHFETPTGTFYIYSKVAKKRLSGHDRETGESWDIPDVPYILFYHGGVAIHGVYWHNRFGTGERLSHGCVGLAPSEAAILYEWAERGTPVVVY